eukprot:TRINITY_DN2786_c0_g1_i1.p1 TRINITY_DN2786_c0_g1~~TRINITY_DN2786_c0_g1_i1.p1  ORF type:complete len:167 (+),score=57.53 TRINITY_DN2786_c0_g1_i1:382-882(+)
MAFMQGKLKIAGSMAHAMKLGGLLQEANKLKIVAPAAAPATSAAPAAASSSGDFKSSAIFDQIRQKLKTDGAEFVKKIGAIYAFKLTSASGKTETFIVDLKNGTGSVSVGDAKADTTLTLKDDDFMAMNAGKLDSQMAFMQGKLKIAGNMAHAMKLNMLLSQVAKL